MFSKIISFFMSIWVFLCSLLGIGAGKGETPEFIDYSNGNKTVIVSISENPSTGYGWEYNVSNETVIKLDKNDYINPKQTNPPIAGALGTRVFNFSGLKSGTALVTLTYERSWENEPVRTIVIQITVADDLTLNAELISDISA